MEKRTWIVTERTNVFLSLGVLLLVSLGISWIPLSSLGHIGLSYIIVGIWLYVFYSWEDKG